MDKLSVEISNLPDQFASLLAQAEPGHEIIVTEGGHPRAVLTPLPHATPEPPIAEPGSGPEPTTTGPTDEVEVTVTFLGESRVIRVPVSPPGPEDRVPGLSRGLIKVMTENDGPLPDEFWFGES